MGIFGKKDTTPKKTKEELKKEQEEKKIEEEEKKFAESERQVELAYRFLTQANVQKIPDYEKRAFLRKKGLTTDQIDRAFKKRDTKPESDSKTSTQQNTQQSQGGVEGSNQVVEAKPQQQENKIDTEPIEQKLERAYKNGFLSLKNSNITELNPKIFEVSNLKTLVASQNLLKEIPAQIGNFINLRVAQFSECGLTDDTIHTALFSLPNLVELNLSGNKITSINLIVNLPVLQRLDVSDNDIVELPEDIEKCSKLQLLNLKNNHITFFPHNFTKLTNLKRIEILLIKYVQQAILNQIKKVISGNKFEKEAEVALQNSGVEGLFKFLSQ